MNGYAGPSPSKKKRQEISTSRGCAWNLKKECAGPAVGPAAYIVEISFAVILGREPLFEEPFGAFLKKRFLKPGGRF
jgi:hypothetical protein